MKLICGKCRKKINSENSDFCPKCGASLSLASEIPEKEDLRSPFDKKMDEDFKNEFIVDVVIIAFALIIIALQKIFGWQI